MKMLLLKLKEHNRLNLALLLSAMAIFCFALSLFRYYMTHVNIYLFLNWNLFLAFVPWLVSTLIIISPKLHSKKLGLLLMLGIWLPFFPNSPYIFTDLFHMRYIVSAPIWFDLMLILSFAWTGMVYGLVSLLDLEYLMRQHFSRKVSNITVTLLLFLASFGVYLGRFLRFNTWDVVQKPGGLFMDVLDRFADPLSHPRTWGVTILMGIFLNFMFWSIKLIKRDHEVA